MYSNAYASQNPGADLSNNPFINDPSNPHTRFPDISGSLSPPQLNQQPSYNSGYPQQPQFQQQYQAAQYPGPNQYASTSYTGQYPGNPQNGQIAPQPTGRAFQPSSSFGQHLVSQVDSSQPQYQQPYNTGYQPAYQNTFQPQQQYPQAGYQGYGQQPQQQNTGYLAEFDPYAQTPNQASSHNRSLSTSGNSTNMHPRDYIRSHKAELEAWDSYAWKQMLNACDMLKAAWGARKQEIERTVSQMGGNGVPGFFGQNQYGGPQAGYGGELERWQRMLKEADSNQDTIAASHFQLHEVYTSYRQSGDAASKRRVRESCNAALTYLPDWPGSW
ncbi:hypothetical protein BJ138DRAFT_1174178 [Hygrophoropsis aurantiaca]|uniref:Uncharacterized protein n=1 Tax=Hygrophoropsis aurantiaca TaxID=72124 RepID=A0ACB8A5S9_9AGAM|nr:hypothetical protein BJ138DRAFT_1174178 [Hygrophoropsis aurantiaca]